jgi:hypothetical protein
MPCLRTPGQRALRQRARLRGSQEPVCHPRLASIAMAGDSLLAGPRGRRLCWILANEFSGARNGHHELRASEFDVETGTMLNELRRIVGTTDLRSTATRSPRPTAAMIRRGRPGGSEPAGMVRARSTAWARASGTSSASERPRISPVSTSRINTAITIGWSATRTACETSRLMTIQVMGATD